MTGDRLTGSDKRALLLWVAAGILGLLFAQKYFFRAFPEASVNFQVSREEALARSQKFVTGLGENVNGYRSTVAFDVDDDAKTYIERELGLQQANLIMSSDLHVWFWNARFFKPQQEEEFRVRVSPAGQIAGYEHKIEESRAGPSLERAAAQTAAQDYLTSKLGIDLKAWDVLPEEANSKKKPNRLDWSFTWEKHGFRAKDAPYRLQVSLQGDRIGGSEEFLKVPEAWERSFARLRSGNNTLALVFTVPYIALLAIAVWLAIRFTKQGKTSWRGAILLGLIVAALLFLQNLNDWPHWASSYDTNQSYGIFITRKMIMALLFSVLSALTVTLVLPSAEPLYRASQPDRMRLSRAFTLRGLRSKEFFSAAVVGVSMAATHIGYVVAFYVVASRFGAWAPQELNFDDSVNTAFPWISGAAIGLLASTNEEFTFRLFAIPFFNRITHSRWIAVIVPAFLWSFLHSNYLQEPAYIRGIEIGLVGIVAGMVMLRWGIVATLIWHYTVDASLVGLLLMRSNNLYFRVSGAVVAAAALAPLAFACISHLSRGGFETDEDLLNRAEAAPEIDFTAEPAAATAETKSIRYDALAPAMIAFLAVCVVVGGALAWRLKPQGIGDYLKLSLNARSARARADEILRQRHLEPKSYVHAAVLMEIADPIINEYLRQRVGIPGINAIYANQIPAALWRVRYFRDSQPEEFAVILRPAGSLYSVGHTLAEETQGASLTKEEASARAEKFLTEEKKIDLKAWALVESSSDKKPHRIDHSLTWQQNMPLDADPAAVSNPADHAYARLAVQVLGDEVTNYRTYIKIPDEWVRQRKELTPVRTIVNFGIPGLFFGGLGVTALMVFLKNLKSEAARAIPWKRIGISSFWGICGYLVMFALGSRIADLLNLYDTSNPLKYTYAGIAITLLFGAPLIFSAIALLFGMAWFYAVRAFGEERLPGWLGMPANYYRDAFCIGLGGSAALLGLERLLAVASAHWPTVHRSLPASFGQEFDAILPAAALTGGTIQHGLLLTGIVVAVAAFVAAQVRHTGLRILLLLLGALSLAPGNWGSPADLAKQFLAGLIVLSVLVFGVRRVIRFNILGCFLIVGGTSLLGGASELLSQPDSFYRANGYAVLLALALLFAWPFVAWRMGDSARAAGDASSAL
ncbi:MAG TPA: CPBP family intramembrane glutamic endopeptidase [Candidatus Dormibacteraeota bacterium]|nr:CPBP family intramembrane glutamic endopeptidase [Candidatus Dormibacteraeota bacterium]